MYWINLSRRSIKNVVIYGMINELKEYSIQWK